MSLQPENLPPLPNIPSWVADVLNVMGLNDLQRNYLEAMALNKFYGHQPEYRDRLGTRVTNTVMDLRESLNHDAPTSPDVNDHIFALNRAFEDLYDLETNSQLTRLPGFQDALKKRAAGLVGQKIRELTAFRQEASIVVTPVPPAPVS